MAVGIAGGGGGGSALACKAHVELADAILEAAEGTGAALEHLPFGGGLLIEEVLVESATPVSYTHLTLPTT